MLLVVVEVPRQRVLNIRSEGSGPPQLLPKWPCARLGFSFGKCTLVWKSPWQRVDSVLVSSDSKGVRGFYVQGKMFIII